MNVNSGSEVILLMTNSFLLIKKKKKKSLLIKLLEGFFFASVKHVCSHLHLSDTSLVVFILVV